MKNKKKMVIGILILCVIVGGIAGGLIYKGQQNKEIQLFEYDKLDTIEHTKRILQIRKMKAFQKNKEVL